MSEPLGNSHLHMHNFKDIIQLDTWFDVFIMV